jgi:hypothetical protein
MTALAIACKEGCIDIAFQLLAAGAYVNIQVRVFFLKNGLVAICHSFYIYFLSYNTLQNMIGSHHTIYDGAWAG